MKASLRTLARDGSFARQAGFLAGGSAVSQLLVLASAPALARLYSAEAWGAFGLIQSIVAVLGTVSALGLERAIVSAESDEEAASLLVSAAVLIPVTIVLGVTVIAGGIRLNLVEIAELSGAMLLWAAATSAMVQLYTTLRYWQLRAGRFALISRTTVTQNAGRAALPLMFGATFATWTGLAAGEFFARLLGIASMLPKDTPTLRRVSWGSMRLAVKRNIEFVTMGGPSTLLNSMTSALPVALIASRFGLPAAGQFALVQRILQAPIALVGASVADTFHVRLARYAEHSPLKCKQLFLRTAAALAILAVCVSLVVLLGADRGFDLLIGSRWGGAEKVAMALLPWIALQLVVSPVSRAVLVFGGQRSKLAYDVAALALLLAAVTISHRRGTGVVEAIAFIAAGQAAAYAVYFSVLLRLINKHHQSSGTSKP